MEVVKSDRKSLRNQLDVRSRLIAAGAVAALAMALTTTPGTAKDYKVEGAFAWVAKGDLLQTGKDNYYWVGSYNGVNVMADPKSPLQNVALVCPGWLDVGAAGGGYCQETVDKDNVLYVQWDRRRTVHLYVCVVTEPRWNSVGHNRLPRRHVDPWQLNGVSAEGIKRRPSRSRIRSAIHANREVATTPLPLPQERSGRGGPASRVRLATLPRPWLLSVTPHGHFCAANKPFTS